MYTNFLKFCLGVTFLFTVSVSLLCSNSVGDSAGDSATDHDTSVSPFDWPLVKTPETKPWTWWWWHGSAVTKKDITAELEKLHKSGIGGVNIVCLLDVKDDIAVKLEFLSEEWIEAITHAVREARRLGMDVDMPPVPGWAFGGPWVTREDACSFLETAMLSMEGLRNRKMNLYECGTGPNQLRRGDLATVQGYDTSGQRIDLTENVDENGVLQWTPPSEDWTFYIAWLRKGSSRVRMPLENQDGWVVDHLSIPALERYFKPFDDAFARIDTRDLPRAFNNDSWEIFLDWTPDLFEQFERRRGYDLREYYREFVGDGDPEIGDRVTCDYRATVSDLMVEHFTKTMRKWAAKYDRRIIGEAIHEPANDLDTFAEYDIPQVDVGGPNSWYFSNKRVSLERYKLGSSSAHILGMPLISSETLTCFGPILDTPMAPIKDKLDVDFLGGINHTMFHGITYSPEEARWPGWLFYAGFHLGHMNPMWRQGPKLCDYVTRCQSLLQQGKPDNDLLIYYPTHDLWSSRPIDGQTRKPVKGLPRTVVSRIDIVPTASELWHQGYDFALFSDRTLQAVQVENNEFVAPGGRFRTLVIADCRLLPETTLQRILNLVEQGGTVVLAGTGPEDVPGLADLEKRRESFHSMMKRIKDVAQPVNGVNEGRIRKSIIGKGVIFSGGNTSECLAASGLSREHLFDRGLFSIRRIDEQGTTYFIVNPYWNDEFVGWLPLKAEGRSVVLLDPMDGKVGLAKSRSNEKEGTDVFLQLAPRESCFLRVLHDNVEGPAWNYYKKSGEPVVLAGQPWHVSFIDGGETIPEPENVTELTSWTTWGGKQEKILRGFSGVAKYSLRFDKPSFDADEWEIDPGEVLHTVRITLNGVLLGDRFTTPMSVRAGSAMKDKENLLEIEVANTPINRAADLDISGIHWQKTIGEDAATYRIGDFLFPYPEKRDPLTWTPAPSGLLGPVRLIPLKRLTDSDILPNGFGSRAGVGGWSFRSVEVARFRWAPVSASETT